ncbi:uncharacterized protein LOC135817779 [Sycon ciliatum]|uniref:uncharacterized protein LOC135817779 n=1 Tax=Sycon ciliatum TaxID=27933 RepID=UPI0031F6E8FC
MESDQVNRSFAATVDLAVLSVEELKELAKGISGYRGLKRPQLVALLRRNGVVDAYPSDADLRQVDIVIADIAHNVTTCNIDQVFKSVYQLEGLALRLECPAEMIADMKGAERGQCYADTIYKMLKNYKRKCAERRDSEIGQKMVSLLVDNGYRALVAGGDVSPVPVAAFCQYQGIVGAELTVAKPATTPKEDSGFGSEGSVCGGRRGSMVSPESGICLRTPAICQESSPNGHDATGPERYITSPNHSAIPESRHEEEDGEPMYESSYTYIVHQVTPGQK